MTAADTALELVARINAHDVEAIAGLLTGDHRFVDSLGNEVHGRDTLRNGWQAYFRMVPDYRIEVQRMLTDGPLVVLLGTAHGTYCPDGVLAEANAWSTPAALRALVREGQVAEWQVYADNEPLRRRMAAAPGGG